MPSASADFANKSLNWAVPVDRLTTSDLHPDAVTINVAGRKVTNPVQGFGPMWQKTYRIHLTTPELTPQQVIQTWRENFGSFWPKGNHFYAPPSGIVPGSVAVLHMAGPGGMTAPGGLALIATGVLVIYSDEDSFSFLTPQGHMFAGMITFSSFEEENGVTAQVQALVRASDPLFELTYRLGIGHKMEDNFWMQTLQNLAASFGTYAPARMTKVCYDPNVQWSKAGNIWHNAAIRTTLYLLTVPFRRLGRRLRKKAN
jgi:hypothetical protein